MDSEYDDIRAILGVTSAEAAGLVLLKKRNFDLFLKFIDAGAMDRFRYHLKLIQPDNDAEFPSWMKACIKALGLSQKELCLSLKISETHFSRFLNGSGKLTEKDFENACSEINKLLISKNLIPTI